MRARYQGACVKLRPLIGLSDTEKRAVRMYDASVSYTVKKRDQDKDFAKSSTINSIIIFLNK